MPQLAMRIETSSDIYTNAASENSHVFDVTVAAVVVDLDNIVNGEHEGRPTIVSALGAYAFVPEYSYNISDTPADFKIFPTDEDSGIYADNPTGVDGASSAVESLVHAENGDACIFTFIGNDAIEEVMRLMDEGDSVVARYIKSVSSDVKTHVEQMQETTQV